ncbi:MAG: hypothetical protein KDJ35_02320 [Alphaproteobacteria bacterium]|nr:hypothetical protein [Alphaproteobacteria bacterium]
MAKEIEIKVEKFLSITPIYFILAFLLFVGLPLTYVEKAPEMTFVNLFCIGILFFALKNQKALRKNPVILKTTKEGIELPHRFFQLNWKSFVSWDNFEKAEVITKTILYGVRPKSLAIFYRDKNSYKYYMLPYSHGNGDALNHSHIEIIKMLSEAKNG